IQHDDVGLQAFRDFHRLATRRGLRGDLPARLRLEEGAHAPADDGMIVHHDDAQRRHVAVPGIGTLARTVVPWGLDSISSPPRICLRRSRMPPSPTPRAPTPPMS